MDITFGEPAVTIRQLSPRTRLTVYRIVGSDSPDDPVFVRAFRSHYELSEEPRRVERQSAVIHMGISTYIDERSAVETARRWPKLGDYIARVDLEPGHGFNFALTGHPRHLTIWGDAIKLAEATSDIRPVRD